MRPTRRPSCAPQIRPSTKPRKRDAIGSGCLAAQSTATGKRPGKASGLLREERAAERGEFFRGVPLDEMLAAADEVQVELGVELGRERGAFRGMAAVLSSVDHPQRRPHWEGPTRCAFGRCGASMTARTKRVR